MNETEAPGRPAGTGTRGTGTRGTRGTTGSAGTGPRASAGTGRAAASTSLGRIGALARAELTLLGRSKGTLVAALFVPLVLPLSVRSAATKMDLAEAGLSVGTVVLPAAVGFSLLFAVYSALVGVFVVRREELVLKRLRTGELRDAEIIAGSALPASLTGLAQCLLLTAACSLLLDLPAPPAPHLAVAGLLLGLVLCAALAAVTASHTRTGESAQVTPMPLMIVSMMGSGMFVPLELLPDRLASVCELLPLTPVLTLVRAGWTGALPAGETLAALATAVAWTALAVFAVRRWFRWEPRR
ncbi:ABC transporter permease [Streptomyces tagetis]|uniref:Transport permease protein n=1 Tax=Streptomyces tagetis TaxID=2820809 RepID=A0A940XNM0_9ACTN|nr:ABC transporter permease [Streptomyces sp. RG38]MBQ0827894.1 ABC transporter permease [Streptomyces sp. RG38]